MAWKHSRGPGRRLLAPVVCCLLTIVVMTTVLRTMGIRNVETTKLNQPLEASEDFVNPDVFVEGEGEEHPGHESDGRAAVNGLPHYRYSNHPKHGEKAGEKKDAHGRGKPSLKLNGRPVNNGKLSGKLRPISNKGPSVGNKNNHPIEKVVEKKTKARKVVISEMAHGDQGASLWRDDRKRPLLKDMENPDNTLVRAPVGGPIKEPVGGPIKVPAGGPIEEQSHKSKIQKTIKSKEFSIGLKGDVSVEKIKLGRVPNKVQPYAGNPASGNPVPRNQVPKNPISGNPALGNPVPRNPVPRNPVPKNPVPRNSVSGNPALENPVPRNLVSGNPGGAPVPRGDETKRGNNKNPNKTYVKVSKSLERSQGYSGVPPSSGKESTASRKKLKSFKIPAAKENPGQDKDGGHVGNTLDVHRKPMTNQEAEHHQQPTILEQLPVPKQPVGLGHQKKLPMPEQSGQSHRPRTIRPLIKNRQHQIKEESHISRKSSPDGRVSYTNNEEVLAAHGKRADPNTDPKAETRLADIIPNYTRDYCHPDRDQTRVRMRYPLSFDENLETGGGGRVTNLRYCQRIPKVILIGAGKCGTAALANFLNLSSSIEIAPGEIDYFSSTYEKGLPWYLHYMPETTQDQLGMEKSPSYMWHPGVAERVKKATSSVRILVSLCDPIKRLVSRWVHAQYWTRYMRLPTLDQLFVVDNRTGMITRELPLGTKQPMDNSFLDGSRYIDYMRRWLAVFPRNQFHFVNGENLVKNPVVEMREVAEYLGVERFVTSESVYYDKEKGFYCYRRASGDSWCLNSEKGRKHPSVSTRLLHALRKYYKPYNEELFKFIGRRFDWPSYKMNEQP